MFAFDEMKTSKYLLSSSLICTCFIFAIAMTYLKVFVKFLGDVLGLGIWTEHFYWEWRCVNEHWSSQARGLELVTYKGWWISTLCDLKQLSLCFEMVTNILLWDITEMKVKHMVEKCAQLREINLSGCEKLHAGVAASIVFSRPSMRKIIDPTHYCFSGRERELFLHQGCNMFDLLC